MKKEMNLFQLAWPLFVSNILGIFLGFIDVFVLSKVSDLAASAISAACQITSICSLIFSVVCGAAYATMIVKVVCVLIMSWVFFTRVESIRIFKKIAETKFVDLKAIFQLGMPSVFDSVNYSITQLVITGVIFHNLGEIDIISRTYLQNIAMFFQLFTNAIASATQIMVGHEIGAENYEKADKDCKHGLKISVLSTGIICIAATLFSNQLFGIFTDNTEVIRLGFYLMIANIFVELGRAVNVIFVWCLRGAGDVSVPVLVAVACMWVIAVGGSWLSVEFTTLGILGVWSIAGIDECVRGTIMYGRWMSKKWMKKRLV